MVVNLSVLIIVHANGAPKKMPISVITRRQLIKTLLFAAFSLPSNAIEKRKSAMIITGLIDTLKSINDLDCKKLAIKLSAIDSDNADYDFHMRNANLNHHQISLIAQAIKRVDSQ